MLLQHRGEPRAHRQLQQHGHPRVCQQQGKHQRAPLAVKQRKGNKSAHQRRHSRAQHPQQGRAASLSRKNQIYCNRRDEAGDRTHAEHQQECERADRQRNGKKNTLPPFLRSAHERAREQNADGKNRRLDVGVTKDTVQACAIKCYVIRVDRRQPFQQQLCNARAHRLHAQKRIERGNPRDHAHHAPRKRAVEAPVHGNEQEEKHRDEDLRPLAQMKLAGHRPKNCHPRKRRIAEQQQGREVPDPFAVAEHKQRDHTNAREQRQPFRSNAAEMQHSQHRERKAQRHRDPSEVLFPVYPCTHCKSLLSQYFMASLYRFHASVSRRSLAPSIRLCLRCGARHDTINLH